MSSEIIAETLEQKVEKFEKRCILLQEKIDLYENGEQNLYRSLQKKMNEISSFLNSNSLNKIDLTDKSKEFERIFLVMSKCETLATSVKSFGEMCGAIDIKKEDKKSFVDTIAVKRD
jgi:exonuclease VII small subunit